MANIVVRVRQPSSIRVQVQTPSTVTASIRKYMVKNVNLENLLNVNEDAYGLSDGFTILYNQATRTWEPRYATSTFDTSVDLDGGTF